MCQFKLAAFDFDYTLLNANSCKYLNKLVMERESKLRGDSLFQTPSIAKLNNFKYNTTIEAALENGTQKDQTPRMNAIFAHMHSNYGIMQSDMVKCLSELKIGDCMKRLLTYLKCEEEYVIIIVSDSNRFVINTILEQNGLMDMFSGVFANQAYFDQDGKLIVEAFNKEMVSSVNCENEFCKRNICKGEIIENYIEKNYDRARFSSKHVVYVGDGTIDYCAGLKLDKDDCFFVKKNSALSRLLLKNNDYSSRLKCKLEYWKSPDEIRESISKV